MKTAVAKKRLESMDNLKYETIDFDTFYSIPKKRSSTAYEPLVKSILEMKVNTAKRVTLSKSIDLKGFSAMVAAVKRKVGTIAGSHGQPKTADFFVSIYRENPSEEDVKTFLVYKYDQSKVNS